MEMFLAPLPMVYTFHKLFVLQEYVLIFDDLNNINRYLASKLLKQGYRYHKLCKAFFFQNFSTNT